MKQIAEEVLWSATSWEQEVRLIGNLTADEVRALAKFVFDTQSDGEPDPRYATYTSDLRRLGVAVAAGMVRVLRTLLADAEADLAAERAARRKWELRLRARSMHKSSSIKAKSVRWTDLDRLCYREATVVDVPRAQLGYWLNIAGPRGVLP